MNQHQVVPYPPDQTKTNQNKTHKTKSNHIKPFDQTSELEYSVNSFKKWLGVITRALGSTQKKNKLFRDRTVLLWLAAHGFWPCDNGRCGLAAGDYRYCTGRTLFTESWLAVASAMQYRYSGNQSIPSSTPTARPSSLTTTDRSAWVLSHMWVRPLPPRAASCEPTFRSNQPQVVARNRVFVVLLLPVQ